MRDGAEDARDHGVNLAFFGANAVFRQIRLEPSPLGAHRRQVGYKSATADPMDGATTSRGDRELAGSRPSRDPRARSSASSTSATRCRPTW